MYRPKLRILRFSSLVGVMVLLLSVSCATVPPKQVNDVCDIFEDKYDWYVAAKKAHKEWGSPAYVTMAIMHQESRFRAKAKPPRKKYFGFIPGPRPSSAYGYAQAIDPTWAIYKKQRGRWGADRDDFRDAIDFIGWYNNNTRKRNKISLSDPEKLYLAYHEGHTGYAKGSYHKKPWLKSVAKKVKRQAARYQHQLTVCQSELEKMTLKRWFTTKF